MNTEAKGDVLSRPRTIYLEALSYRDGERFSGHWGSGAAFVAAARTTLAALREGR